MKPLDWREELEAERSFTKRSAPGDGARRDAYNLAMIQSDQGLQSLIRAYQQGDVAQRARLLDVAVRVLSEQRLDVSQETD